MKRSVLLALLLSGCASVTPAPITYGPPARENDRAAPPPDSWAGPSPQRTTRNTNAPQQSGLIIGEPRSYRVGDGESIYAISDRMQIPLLSLIEQNGLEPPYVLSAGQTIQLPPERHYRVARGDRFEDIAARFDMDPRSLGLFNQMSEPFEVHEGDLLNLPALPGGRQENPSTASASAPAPQASSGPRVLTPPSATPTPTPPPPSVANARFRWPLEGDVLARFGPQQNGGRLDGVEIAASQGAQVRASDDGEVVFAGQQPQAAGVLVLIRHDGNYVTAYARAGRTLVHEGERVRAGQPIAEAGDSGRILFQVRRGTEAIDPLPLLGGR